MQIPNHQVIYPLLAMLTLPFIVLSLMARTRFAEMKNNRIHPQKMASRSESASLLKNTKMSDNFLNLFEMPILFYILCLLFLFCQNATNVSILLMWIFVLIRYIHSAIHCGYNKVMHRFYAFLSSSLFLMLLLINFMTNLS